MSDSGLQTVRVNFARPFPIFPLARVSLLPHAVLPLFIFEKRYRQMVEHVLDTHGQIAMAIFKGDEYQYNYADAPPVQPAVCIGQVTQHARQEDGTYKIMLHGICRARIHQEFAPDDEYLYRRAVLRPIEKSEEDTSLVRVRRDVLEHLKSKPLADTGGAKRVLSALDERPDLPTPAILELITLGVVAPIDEGDTLYRLLEEGDASQGRGSSSGRSAGTSTCWARRWSSSTPRPPRACPGTNGNRYDWPIVGPSGRRPGPRTE